MDEDSTNDDDDGLDFLRVSELPLRPCSHGHVSTARAPCVVSRVMTYWPALMPPCLQALLHSDQDLSVIDLAAQQLLHGTADLTGQVRI